MCINSALYSVLFPAILRNMMSEAVITFKKMLSKMRCELGKKCAKLVSKSSVKSWSKHTVGYHLISQTCTLLIFEEIFFFGTNLG